MHKTIWEVYQMEKEQIKDQIIEIFSQLSIDHQNCFLTYVSNLQNSEQPEPAYHLKT